MPATAELRAQRGSGKRPAIREKIIALHRGQRQVLESTGRVTLYLAAARVGKTFVGCLWLLDQIHKYGPGDYMVVAPTFPVLNVGAITETRRLYETELRLGTYIGSPHHEFRFDPIRARHFFGDEPQVETRVFYRHAQDPEGLEAATIKAAWLDEAGQKKFRYGSWEAVQRRVTLDQGPILITTTPYSFGWLKTEVYDRTFTDPDHYQLVRSESLDNPRFPVAEWERAKRTLPGWRFDMMYRGIFRRPAGQIYDCFDSEAHVIPAFNPPPEWRRYLGMDFGGVNTAALWLAEDPKTGKLHAYREYHAGGLTMAQHKVAILKGEPGLPYKCFGGSKSEQQWRDELRQAGLAVNEPDVADVEIGIQRVYGLIKTGAVAVHDCCKRLIDQLGSYSRPVDDQGNVLDGIEDKAIYHQLDALRYIGSWLARSRELRGAPALTFGQRDERDQRVERNVFAT